MGPFDEDHHQLEIEMGHPRKPKRIVQNLRDVNYHEEMIGKKVIVVTNVYETYG